MEIKLFDVPELARRTMASRAFWRKQILLKRIPVLRIGRCVRVSESDLLAFLDARKQEARP